jgi:hypothetical protein
MKGKIMNIENLITKNTDRKIEESVKREKEYLIFRLDKLGKEYFEMFVRINGDNTEKLQEFYSTSSAMIYDLIKEIKKQKYNVLISLKKKFD